jgi:hypothetical protein
MAIRFFFEYEKTVIQLPVNPSEIKITTQGHNVVQEIIKLGEINLLRDRKLKTLTISSFFPRTADAPYVLTKGKFEGPDFYKAFFEKIMHDKKPARLVISDLGVNFLVSIESFEWDVKAMDDDVHYSIRVMEYREYSAKTVVMKNANAATTSSSSSRAKTGFAIGDTVLVNGKYWYTSYGDSPFGTFKDFTGKISHIVSNKSRKYRYHITTTSGGWRGWVAESQIKHV